MKTCITCKLEKEKSEFYIRSGSPDKLHYHCKECTKTKRNAYNKKLGSEHFRKYTLARTAKLSNITVEQAFEALRNQDYKCKICNTPESELTKRLCLDHCHATGNFRGMICNSCNVGLANFKDNPELMLQAIEYLKNSK